MLRSGMPYLTVAVAAVAVGLLATPLAWGQGPAITLSKTVGTTPGVCAGTNSVTVTTGTDVYYCFVATNTGTVTLNFHDLVDDHLGTVLDNFPYTLAPGASSPEVIIDDTAAATVTNVATWTAVDAIGGYSLDDTIAVDYEDISATGTAFTLADDAVSAALPIGFTFDFYSAGYTSAYVSSNGFMTFTSTTNSGCCTGQAMPTAAEPNNLVAGWWEDLDPGEAGAALYYQTLGTAPNRRFVVQFSNVQHYPTGNPVTMEYKLFEGTNVVEVHYQAAPGDGTGTHSAGIENANGTVGLQYYLGTAALTTPLAVRYTPTVAQQAQATATATVTIADPDITVNPASLVSVQVPDQILTQPLDLGNVGVVDLLWTLDEEPIVTDFPEITEPAGPGDATRAAERRNEVPEGKTPDWAPEAVSWSGPEVVLYDNGPMVTHPGGGAGGADASALQDVSLGMGTYGFGAQLSAGNRVADDVTVTDAAGWTIDTITFFAYQTGSGTTSSIISLNLQIWDGPPNAGGTVIWGDTTTNLLTSTTWANDYRVLEGTLTATDRPIMACVATVNTTLQAGTYWLDWQFGGSASFSGPWQPPVTILGQTTTGNAIQYTSTGWAALVDVGPQGLPFIIDGVLAICGNPSDVPWLSASPTAGTIAPSGTQQVTVSFNSTGVAVGLYQANLCVYSNDPDEGIIAVPVTMDVVIPVELQSFSAE